MDFTLINSFVAVADEGSFSAAAKHLFLSQQSLSKQVARLEEELGTTLLVRSRPLHLTADGRLFLQTAREMLRLKAEYEENASHGNGAEKQLHVGIEHTLARSLLPRILPQYLREHRDTYVRITEESPDALEKAVSYEGVDLVIGSIHNPPSSYQTVPLCKKEQLLVVPKALMDELGGSESEALRRRFAVLADMRFFEKAPFIRQPRDSSGGRSLLNYCRYYHIAPHFVCEVTNVENAFQLAVSGLGVLVYARLFWDTMPRKLQQDYLELVDVFPLPYLPDTDKVCAYYRRGGEASDSTQELLELFKAFFADYEQGKLSTDDRQ